MELPSRPLSRQRSEASLGIQSTTDRSIRSSPSEYYEMHTPTLTTWLLRSASLVSAAWAARSLMLQLDEERQLRRFLGGIDSVSDRDELVAMRRKLSSTIAYDFER